MGLDDSIVGDLNLENSDPESTFLFMDSFETYGSRVYKER